MVYISNGAVVQKRSPWRVSIIVDFFLAIVNLIVVFLRTLYDPAAVAQVRGAGAGGSSSNNRRGGGGGGGGRGGGPRIMGLDTLNKADHNARCGGGG